MATHGILTAAGSDGDLTLNGTAVIFEMDSIPVDGTLDALHIYCDTTFGGDWRWCLYKGGAGADDPDGATVVFDTGEFTPANTTFTNVTAGGQALLSTDRLWLAGKRVDTNMWSRYVTGAAGDYPGNGRNNYGESSDETIAFATIAATGDNSVAVDSVVGYIEYTAAGVDTIFSFPSPAIGGAAVTVGDGTSRARHFNIPSGEFSTDPFWLVPDSDANRAQRVDNLPAEITFVAGTISASSSEP